MIPPIIFGIFCVLHGLVHLLYFGQSARYFELQTGMIWPDGAWLVSKFVGNESVRMLANILLIVAAIGFVAGGAGLLFNQTGSLLIIRGMSIFSTALYLLLWDGSFRNLADKGGVGILINLAILFVMPLL